MRPCIHTLDIYLVTTLDISWFILLEREREREAETRINTRTHTLRRTDRQTDTHTHTHTQTKTHRPDTHLDAQTYA